jgi:microtubule-associated protein-like 6
VHDIFVNEDYIVTGGKDGKVNFFTQYMEKVFTIDMAKVVETITDLQGKPLCSYDGKAPCVKSLFMEGTQLLVGTKGSEIFEFDMSTEDSWKTRRRIITQGHSAGYDEKRRIQTSELWGLTTHPFLPQFVSAGDDKTLRVYDMYQRRQIAVRNVSSKVRSASYSPDGKFIAAGFFGGGFIVFDTNTGNELVAKKHRRECIGDIKFSPSGRWLAVGSHDNFVDVYDASRNFKRVGVCKGHSSYITHLDWSEDSRYLQTNSGDYELDVLGDSRVRAGQVSHRAQGYQVGLVDVHPRMAGAGRVAEARRRHGRQRVLPQRRRHRGGHRGRLWPGQIVSVPQRRGTRGLPRLPGPQLARHQREVQLQR